MTAEMEDFERGAFSSRGPQDVRSEASTIHSYNGIILVRISRKRDAMGSVDV